MSIGKGSSIAGGCVISAVRSVQLEDNVLLARNVYISDHMHKYTDTEIPVIAQGIDNIKPVLVKRGAWLGQNVVVCPGVTIGGYGGYRGQFRCCPRYPRFLGSGWRAGARRDDDTRFPIAIDWVEPTKRIPMMNGNPLVSAIIPT